MPCAALPCATGLRAWALPLIGLKKNTKDAFMAEQAIPVTAFLRIAGRPAGAYRGHGLSFS